MKNKIYLILFFVLLGAPSCKKQLDTIPTDFITSVNYYSTAAEFNKGLAGVYATFMQPYVYQEALLSYMSYGNDEAIFIFPQAQFLNPSSFGYSANEVGVTSLWNDLYMGINRANIIIEATDAPNASGVPISQRDNFRAQALFLRAYFHFMLADRFGDIPMKLSSTKTADEINIARTPVKEVYAKIIEDMTAAEAVLPQASTLGAKSSGRLSKNAAQGILARVCLYMAGFPVNDESKYADALAWCTKVITTADNSLDPSYSDLFVKEARDEYYVRENMWEVEFYGNYQDTHRSGGFVGIRNGVTSAISYDFMRAATGLYVKYQQNPTGFLSKDLRRERNFAAYIWSGGNATIPQAKTYRALNTGLYERWPAKWRRDEEIALPPFRNGNGTNFPILRYSDVLLMFAEAENHINGPTVAAYNAINQVRERAYGTGYRVNSITLTNQGSGYPTPTYTNNVLPITVDVKVAASGDANGASTAQAFATVALGKVTAITLYSMGAFYTATPPLVTISSSNGLGSGATAIATVEAIIPSEADLTPGLTKDQFFDAIKDERSRELCFEILRSRDLRRWGILIQTIKDYATLYPSAPAGQIKTQIDAAAANITDKHLFFPIPPSEIATNALMKQNPGW